MRELGLRFWLAFTILTTLFAAATYPLITHVAGMADDLFEIGVWTGVGARVLFIAIYTILGLRGSSKWWKYNIGTIVVLLEVSALPYLAALGVAVSFNNGQLTTPLLVWIEIAGMLGSSLLVLWLSYIWLQVSREGHLQPKE